MCQECYGLNWGASPSGCENQIPEVIQTDLVRDLDAIGTSARVFVAMEVEKKA
ncbi:MAG: hypothetical protein V1844_24570 [Pseudomonadota bacterium]